MASVREWQRRLGAAFSSSDARRAAPDSRRKQPTRPPLTTQTGKQETDGDHGDNRFRRGSRLSGPGAYRAVFRNARASKDRLFTVLYRQSSGGTARLGLAIAKKHCRLATQRNRLKRLVRESFRLNKNELTGLDIVVLNTRATTAADNPTIRKSLDRHWQRCAQDRPLSDGG